MTDPIKPKRRHGGGFGAMSLEKRTAIAARGGAAVPHDKRSFFTNTELAREAGRKGGAVCRPKPVQSDIEAELEGRVGMEPQR